MQKILQFLRTWTLAVSILIGALMYLVFIWFPSLQPYEGKALNVVKTVQPWFIFSMLFITFCKVNPRDLHLQRWHLWHLLIQAGCFILLALPLIFVATEVAEFRPIIEAAMLCLICPTATAAAVITGKLGGDMAGLTTYTILINLVVAVVIPAFVPLINPDSLLGFWTSFGMIIGKVFPLLICPFLLAVALRCIAPSVLRAVTSIKDLAFYLWAVSLALAIMVSVKSLCETTAPLWVLGGIAAASLITCIMQFALGRALGRPEEKPISAGQALGQKNTVFLIWCGYTFFDPISSVAGGFYSIWHNMWNTYQIAHIKR